MIDILIPTYNRARFLKKNILLLDKLIVGSCLQDSFRIIVSDNCSTDETVSVLSEIDNHLSVRFLKYRQAKNIGLEPNALFLLGKATSEYIMYLGDDDYIPYGYLDFVFEKIRSEGVNCVIPGFSALSSDNIVTPSRNASFAFKKYGPGFFTVCRLSSFGHQLSGLVTRRSGLYDEYMKREGLRNIYPFIFFVSYCMLRGDTYYAPQYQVLVSQGNRKDWAYDESGLLVDIFKNYQIAFPENSFKAVWASLTFARIQSWRLRVGKNLINAFKAFAHLTGSREVSALIKVCLIVLYTYCYGRWSMLLLKRRLFPV